MSKFTEDVVALDRLEDVGYTPVFGGVIAPGEPAAERSDYREV